MGTLDVVLQAFLSGASAAAVLIGFGVVLALGTRLVWWILGL